MSEGHHALAERRRLTEQIDAQAARIHVLTGALQNALACSAERRPDDPHGLCEICRARAVRAIGGTP